MSKSAREYLDEDLEAVSNGFPMGSSPLDTMPLPMSPPGMMPGYYPVDTNRLAPAMLGTVVDPAVPFYKRPMVTFAAGAIVVGAAWIYFDVVRPRMKKAAKK